jgi:cytochrome P450
MTLARAAQSTGTRRPRPAAPRPLDRPLNLFDLLVALNRNPLEAWTRELYEDPIVTGESLLGRFAVVSDPAAIRAVLVDAPEQFGKDELQKRLLRPALGDGLLTSEGEAWRSQRRAFAPVFAPRSVDGFVPAMRSCAEALVRRWSAMRDGRPIDVAEEMARTMLDMLAATIFGGGLGQSAAAFRQAATRYFETQGRVEPLDLLGAPDWVPRLGRLLSHPALEFFTRVVESIVAERRKRRTSNADDMPADLVAVLLRNGETTGVGMSDSEIAGNIITFIGAGFETPANALTWALYLLALAPDWRRQVEAEVDAAFGAKALSLATTEPLHALHAHLEEAMRLYPPVAIMTRRALVDQRLGGRHIAAGSTIILAPWIIHRHRRLWEEPDDFVPERFLPERRQSVARFAYLPFGAGPRVCIGGAFAMQQMTITLAAIVRHFRLELVASHRVDPVHRITLRPEGGMPMTLHRRPSAKQD